MPKVVFRYINNGSYTMTALKKFINISIIILTIAVFLCSCKQAETETENANLLPPQVTNEFTVSFLKVGKADAIILQTANHSAVIDCGEEDDSEEILQFLSDNSISCIDYLFITHFDKDHVGGVANVLNGMKTEKIITPLYEGSNDEYNNYIKAAQANNIVPIKLADNMSFILDDVLFEVYPPQKTSYKEDDNDFSLAISVTHGDNTFLFTGDAEEERLSEIIKQTNREYSFLKVPHHGRYNNDTENFIKQINPSYSVITCSKKNMADEETINALENNGSAVYLTMNGDIKTVSDGQTINVTQKGIEK